MDSKTAEKYILFGAGADGERMYQILGDEKTFCFADNAKAGGTYLGKEVVSFEEMKRLSEVHRIIISSADYAEVLEQQVLSAGISNYEVMGDIFPVYSIDGKAYFSNYAQSLSNYDLKEFGKIAIYGTNYRIYELLSEIDSICGRANILGIIRREGVKEYAPTGAHGVDFISFEHALKYADCIILNVSRRLDPIRERLMEQAPEIPVIDLFDIDGFIPIFHHLELERFRGIHEGERCFIIGNGPSLRAEDLTLLSNNKEFCFGGNRIYKIYKNTQWRPDYYCIADLNMLNIFDRALNKEGEYDQVKELSQYLEDNLVKKGGAIFAADIFNRTGEKTDIQADFVHLTQDIYQESSYPGFSKDITKQVYWGHTVTYDLMLQIAVFMGFKTIYLLGCDNTLVNDGNVSDESRAREHFCIDYYTEDDKKLSLNFNKGGRSDLATRAYKKAAFVAKKNGIEIINATRGGSLEEFPRRGIDEII